MGKFKRILALTAIGAAQVQASIHETSFDLPSVQDPSTLEVFVLRDWHPAAKNPGIRQKTIEITVCEWWAGRRVRIPVSFHVPADRLACENIVISNMGLATLNPMPDGALVRLIQERHVGVVLVGMGPIEMMKPVGELHLGMKANLLSSRDTRYTPAWIWGMSYMRGLTAALLETTAFRLGRVLATGGSKCGIASAAAVLHDPRFTACMAVVAPAWGNPAGQYVIGTESPDVLAQNAAFMRELREGARPSLPESVISALGERRERQANERITLDQARRASWDSAEIADLNQQAWDFSRLLPKSEILRLRHAEWFYHDGSNDDVSPDLLELAIKAPEFPIFIMAGGQHGGPKTTGFTRQVPVLPESDENLFGFATHHFFNARRLPVTPRVQVGWDGPAGKVHVVVIFPAGIEPELNNISWSVNRHLPGSIPYEYDSWLSVPLRPAAPSSYTADLPASPGQVVDLLTAHADTVNGIRMWISSPYLRIAVP